MQDTELVVLAVTLCLAEEDFHISMKIHILKTKSVLVCGQSTVSYYSNF